jgi:hypothetical protein
MFLETPCMSKMIKTGTCLGDDVQPCVLKSQNCNASKIDLSVVSLTTWFFNSYLRISLKLFGVWTWLWFSFLWCFLYPLTLSPNPHILSQWFPPQNIKTLFYHPTKEHPFPSPVNFHQRYKAPFAMHEYCMPYCNNPKMFHIFNYAISDPKILWPTWTPPKYFINSRDK